jgi:hypothetical protein
LGLLEDSEVALAPCGTLIQNFNRWLLATFSVEAVVEGEIFTVRNPPLVDLSLGASESAIDQILGIKTRTTNTCSACGHVASREGSLNVIDIQYLRKVSPHQNKKAKFPASCLVFHRIASNVAFARIEHQGDLLALQAVCASRKSPDH